MTLPRTILQTIPASTALLLSLLAAPSLQAIEVTTLVDENGTNSADCALREAVVAIKNGLSFGGCTFTTGDTLVDLGAGTFQLSIDNRVEISRSMTIRGEGPGATTIERTGAMDDHLLFVSLPVGTASAVTVEGLTVRGAAGQFNSAITYIGSTDHHLELRDLVIRDNAGGQAALKIDGDGDSSASLERVVFEDNTNDRNLAAGGGMQCEASSSTSLPSVILTDVVFRNNSATGSITARGGGLFSKGCDLTLTHVTFDANTASSSTGDALGGGMAVADYFGPATDVALTNVTFVGNSAQTGGGLFQFTTGAGADFAFELANVTFAGNTASLAGDHLFQNSASARLRNVLFGPTAGSDCDGNPAPSITLLGGNMDSDGSCGVEQTRANPGLAGAPANRGAFTPTLALTSGAAAIDAGTDSGCPATDQRGAARPQDGDSDSVPNCDVGAFEFVVGIFADDFETGDTSAWSATAGATP